MTENKRTKLPIAVAVAAVLSVKSGFVDAFSAHPLRRYRVVEIGFQTRSAVLMMSSPVSPLAKFGLPRAFNPPSASSSELPSPPDVPSGGFAGNSGALFARARSVLATDLGVRDGNLLDDDFIWIGPTLGSNVLGKADYLAAGKFFDLRSAFPDLDYRAHDFRIDDEDPLTVRLTARTVGTMRGELRLRTETLTPNGKQMRCPPEAISMTFDGDTGKLTKLCSGFAMDRLVGNTAGLCGVMAAATVAGAPPSEWEIYPPSVVLGRFFGRTVKQLEEPSSFLAPFPESVMIQLAKGVIAADNGASDPDLLAPSFTFCGPIVGPIGKKEFVDAFGGFNLKEAFPDLDPGFSNFRVDPYDPYRVWVDARGSGTWSGPLLKKEPNGARYEGPPEASSFTFDDDGFCTRITAGVVMDPSAGNTGGLGGVFGILYATGGSLPGLSSRPLPQILARLQKRAVEPFTGVGVDDYALAATPGESVAGSKPSTSSSAVKELAPQTPAVQKKLQESQENQIPTTKRSGAVNIEAPTKATRAQQTPIDSGPSDRFPDVVSSLFGTKSGTKKEETQRGAGATVKPSAVAAGRAKKERAGLAAAAKKLKAEEVASAAKKLKSEAAERRRKLQAEMKAKAEAAAAARKEKAEKASRVRKEQDEAAAKLKREKGQAASKRAEAAAKVKRQSEQAAAKSKKEKEEEAAKVKREKEEAAAKLKREKQEAAAKLKKEKEEKAAKLKKEKEEKAAKLKKEKEEKAAKRAAAAAKAKKEKERAAAAKTAALEAAKRRKDEEEKATRAKAAEKKLFFATPKEKSTTAPAPKGVPTLKNWRKNRDGSLTGLVFGSNDFIQGQRITTSEIASGNFEKGEVVQTESGSKYFLS